MPTDQPVTERTNIEKGIQTDDSLLAPALSGASAGSNAYNQGNSNSLLADGEAEGDVEKQKPKYYDPETMLVHWTGSVDPACQRP